MSLKLTYPVFVDTFKQSGNSIDLEIKNILTKDLSDSETWFRGLALLDLAADQLPANQVEVYDLYKQLVTIGFDVKASVYLIEEDYAFYFLTLIHVLEKLAVHFPVINTQIAFQYRDARRGYKSSAKVKAYLDKAEEQNVPLGVAVKAYFLYFGIEYDKDEVRAEQLLDSADNVWTKLYRGLILLNKGENANLPALLQELKATAGPEEIKSVLVFEANYFDAIEDLEAAKAAYQFVYDTHHSDYALFRLGSMKHAAAQNEAEKQEAFAMWKEAFERGTIDAANFLGYNHLPETEEAGAYDQAIHWFQFGYLYNNAFASYRLALIYLFVPAYEDHELGMHYLDEAVRNKSLHALIEKAELQLEGNIYEKNEEEAIALFQQAAADGAAYALNKLGDFYEAGVLVATEPDVPTALTYFLRAADSQFPRAIDSVGRIYRYGLAGEPDIEKAVDYYQKGAAMNSPFSITELAFMYEDDTLEKDYQKAFDLFSAAAELNYPFAMRMAATYLENGYHNEQPDPEAAFELYIKGAELGDTNANYEVGRCYRFGIGVAENPDKALENYTIAAEAGNPKAMVELGLCYEYEYGVAFDADKAFNYMQQAAELNYYYGQYKLGVYYMHGLITRDTEKAIYWLEKAAEAGFAQAKVELGDYYMYDYDERDEAEKAFAYYHEAQEDGVVREGLGLCYEYGIGVEENAGEAFKFYEMAAHQGSVAAKYHTGRSYLEGNGVKANDEQAFNWFHDAAREEHVAAQYYTGSMLMKGKGTTMNKEEGLEWLVKAAEEDYATAQFELGNCYLMEDGVEESEETAMHWFERAADNGHEQAMKLTGRKQGK
ncbi:tetratricopeptide repeat protein [Pedobacter sp. MR2016-24]|uniref:tetratricopeptide repeat protein n=1 Tax=Pedobacter sp. MR2016-24 TaxID=2994466 RepID=UPI0022451DB1|nr:SEL1-like repeat protein [Pedobacter sp. MR2016-24]MCX2486271.1 hypothetical protein [Pedobacter sp. MR2016-24]